MAEITFSVTLNMSEEVTEKEYKEIGQSIATAIERQEREFGMTMDSDAITQDVIVYNQGGSIVGNYQIVDVIV